jgi:hypothetical protein
VRGTHSQTDHGNHHRCIIIWRAGKHRRAAGSGQQVAAAEAAREEARTSGRDARVRRALEGQLGTTPSHLEDQNQASSPPRENTKSTQMKQRPLLARRALHGAGRARHGVRRASRVALGYGGQLDGE